MFGCLNMRHPIILLLKNVAFTVKSYNSHNHFHYSTQQALCWLVSFTSNELFNIIIAL